MSKVPPSVTLTGTDTQSFIREFSLSYQMLAKANNFPDQGTTAARTAQQRVVGQFFFDTTLGIPIWWNGSAWVNASGTPV